MTDCDTKELGAIKNVFPNAKQLLCRFHLKQAMRNAILRFLGEKQLHKIRNQARTLVNGICEADNREEIMKLINHTAQSWGVSQSLSLRWPRGAHMNGPARFLSYILHSWMTDSMLPRWIKSSYSVTFLGVNQSVTRIPTTNNHTESFNSYLKKALRASNLSSHSFRIDVLVVVLMIHFTPSLLSRRADQLRMDAHRDSFVKKRKRNGNDDTVPFMSTLVFEPDVLRDAGADLLISEHRVICRKEEFGRVSGKVTSATHTTRSYDVTLSTDACTNKGIPAPLLTFYSDGLSVSI
jgi:hypothetical protein